MQHLFNADILRENPENRVRAEHVTDIIPNNPYYVEHSIYFADSLAAFEDTERTKRLVLNVDYEYTALDSVASELSNQDCYRAITFLKPLAHAYLDYHSYGDLVSADDLNELNNSTEQAKQHIDALFKKEASLSKELHSHQQDTAPHGAQQSAVPNTLALRNPSGTLQATEATNEQELTTLGQTNKTIEETKNGLQAEIQKAKEEVLAAINQRILDLIDDAPEELDTLKELAMLAKENKRNIARIKAFKDNTMPLNPVCAFDMADIQNKTIFQHGYFESTGKYQVKFLCNVSAYKDKTIKITVSGYKKGTGGFPELYVYDTNWNWSWHSEEQLNSTDEKTVTATITIPSVYSQIYCTLYHSGQKNNTIVMTRCTIETLDGQPLIDSSGNGNHATESGGVAKVHDDAVGTALLFERGKLTRPEGGFVGVGKKWTHSRWVKIDEHAQDKISKCYLWNYGFIDYCYFGIDVNNGSVGDVVVMTHKDDLTENFLSLTKERLLDNQWHNVIICNDVQPNYARKIVYLDGENLYDKTVNGDFAHLVNGSSVEMSSVNGSLASFLFFDRLLTETEVQWLYLNPYYPAKRYSLAEYKADKR